MNIIYYGLLCLYLLTTITVFFYHFTTFFLWIKQEKPISLKDAWAFSVGTKSHIKSYDRQLAWLFIILSITIVLYHCIPKGSES